MKRKDNPVKIDITIDTNEIKIIAHYDEYNSYAVICSKYSDKVAKITIPQLIDELKRIAEKKNE